jgi:hypothetical protein
MDFLGGQPRIELDIPAATIDDEVFARKRWILTEAWWAAKVAPPSLTTMTSWLGPQDGASQIVNAILGNRPDGATLINVARAIVVPFVSVLAAIILTGYALLRGITLLVPIQAVKDAAVLRTFDNFLTGWFGDVRVLLFDPAQSANIRAGLATQIRQLREVDQVDDIVVMAHSGGAMVSYLTLTDPVYADARVDKLITFGEGFNLAMTLTPQRRGMFDRLRLDVTSLRPNLRWRDFWASHDPAPAGRVKFDEIGGAGGAAHADRIRSRQVWNRRSLLDDHGSYFDNDEEFSLAVLREIDRPDVWGETPPGAPPVSRFYPTPPGNDDATLPPADPRERRHRERVAILALMRQLAIATPVAAITAVLASPTRLGELGQRFADLLNAVPAVRDVGPGIVGFLHDISRPFPVLATDRVPLPELASLRLDVNPAVDLLGLAALQAIVLVSILQLIGAPVRAYQAWSRGSWRWWLFVIVEYLVIDAGLLLAFAFLLLAAPHGTFLDAGWVAWLPGITLAAVTLVFGWSGARLAERLPAITRLYAAGAAIVFLAAMVSAVLVIFRRPHLEVAELGYALIWLSFAVMYRIGHDRWRQWDRVERRAAYAMSPDVAPSRFPVWWSMAGFVAAGIAVVLWLIPGYTQLTFAASLIAIVLVAFAIASGAFIWRASGTQIGAPTAVESARGKV